MRFAIRDDDTNYYTSPEELEFCYKSIWDICPASLSLIPFVQGNWREWQFKFYRDGKIDEWSEWEKDDEVFEIGKNTVLVDFLRDRVKRGQICLTIHGVNHRNKDKIKYPLNRNLIHYAEFFTKVDLTDPLKGGVSYLQELFGERIRVFTPPQNILTIQGYNAVKSNGLHLIGGSIPFISRNKDYYWFIEFCKVLRFKSRYRKKYYPFVMKLGRTNELMVHYPLQETTSLESLKNEFDFVYKLGGDFVLSTHYHGFPIPHTLYKGKIMKNIFDEFFDYVQKYSGVQFCSLNDMLMK